MPVTLSDHKYLNDLVEICNVDVPTRIFIQLNIINGNKSRKIQRSAHGIWVNNAIAIVNAIVMCTYRQL